MRSRIILQGEHLEFAEFRRVAAVPLHGGVRGVVKLRRICFEIDYHHRGVGKLKDLPMYGANPMEDLFVPVAPKIWLC